jgi:hypothetical protein
MNRLCLLLPPLVLAVLTACTPCGTYQIDQTTADNADGERYNGRWTETCGATYGTTGQWNHFGDDLAWITFSPNAPGDRGWQAIDIEITVAFPTTLLVPGTEITAEQMTGGAMINPGITLTEDLVGLTEGSIEIVSGWEGTDVCEPEDGPVFALRWDLLFGGGNGPTYELSANDKVQFSTWLSVECGG